MSLYERQSDKEAHDMKKMVMAVVALGVFFAMGIMSASAQQVTWDDPYQLSDKLKEMAADGKLYGIKDSDGSIMVVSPSVTVSGTVAVAGLATSANDIVASPKGTVFAVTDDAVGIWAEEGGFVALSASAQPKTPDGITGTYKHVAYGEGGKLFVLFEEISSTTQYILIGHEINDAMVVSIDPKTLDLASKGNWVNCKITVPAGYSGKDVDPATVKITRIQIDDPVTDQAVEIFRAAGSPVSATDKGLNLKFWRYNKSNPTDPQSLVYWFNTILPAPGPQKATYDAKVTVEAQLSTTGERFEGTASFKVQVPKAKDK